MKCVGPARVPDLGAEDLAPGAHVCLFSSDEADKRSVVKPFLEAGLKAGQQTVFFADDPEAASAWLVSEGVPLLREGDPGGALVEAATAAYCPDGRFDPDRMLETLAQAAQQATRAGYRSLRVTGETGWALQGVPGSDRLGEYEARVDELLGGLEVTAMCQYNMGDWDGGFLYRLLSLHRYLVVGGRLLEIPARSGAGAEGGADAALLGRLLASLAVMDTLPTSRQLAEFVGAMLRDIPGVRAGALHLLAEPAAPRRAAAWETFTAGEGQVLRLDVGTNAARYGELEIELEDPAAYKPYRPFLANLVTALAFQLESGWRRSQAVHALAESEERYRAIFRTMRDGCGFSRMIYDEEGRPVDWVYLAVNPAFEAILGTSGLEGRRMTEVFPEMNEPLPHLLEIYGRVATTGEPERFELEMPRLGKWMDISVSCPFPGHFMAVYVDVTERRQLEEHLRQVEKMEAVGQLAGGIAHDFNNLLTAILGYSEFLGSHEAVMAAGLDKDVSEIKRAAERGAALTRQMLAFSRRQELRPQLVSLNEVLSGLSPLLRRSLGEHIELVTREARELALTEVDPHQIERVIMNLALNARDAMPQGGRLVLETTNVELDAAYCRTCKEVSPGPYVMLSVTDTGHGMERAVMERIFEPFFTTKAPGEGTGLGLSTVYGIVRQSGGHVAVESRPGRGTTFRVYLPAAIRPDHPAKAADAVVARAGAFTGGQTVLVVEDEAAVRTLVTRILGDSGFKVLAYGSPTDALHVLEQKDIQVDLLLTDVVLPGPLQGDGLAQAALALRPGLAVVFMSGYTRTAVLQAGRIDPQAGYLEKPFTNESLLAKVRERLGLS